MEDSDSIGNDLKMCLNGKNEGPMMVVVDKSPNRHCLMVVDNSWMATS